MCVAHLVPAHPRLHTLSRDPGRGADGAKALVNARAETAKHLIRTYLLIHLRRSGSSPPPFYVTPVGSSG